METKRFNGILSAVLLAATLTDFTGALEVKAAELSFADGKPWKMTATQMQVGSIIFNPDGTGKIGTGIMSMKIS